MVGIITIHTIQIITGIPIILCIGELAYTPGTHGPIQGIIHLIILHIHMAITDIRVIIHIVTGDHHIMDIMTITTGDTLEFTVTVILLYIMYRIMVEDRQEQLILHILQVPQVLQQLGHQVLPGQDQQQLVAQFDHQALPDQLQLFPDQQVVPVQVQV